MNGNIQSYVFLTFIKKHNFYLKVNHDNLKIYIVISKVTSKINQKDTYLKKSIQTCASGQNRILR